MLIDGTEPVSEPDKKLARYIAEQFKPVMLVVNKWDLTRQKLREARKETDDDPPGARPTIRHTWRNSANISIRSCSTSITPDRVHHRQGWEKHAERLDAAQHLFKQTNTRLTTGKLNRVVRQILQEKLRAPPAAARPRIYYATQTDVAPPTIVLFVNNPKFLDENYQRFMINRFRELLPYPEVPMRLLVRGRQSRKTGVSLDEASDDQIEKLAADDSAAE